MTVLETYDAEVLEGGVRCDLRRYEYKPVFPTMARDMLVFLGIVKRGGRVLRAVVSAPPSPLPGAAEDPKYVRMDVALAGFAFERVGAARTKIISVVAMDPATVLGVVQRLAQRGLVAVRTDPGDGRRRLVQLTHDGHELARDLVAIGPAISRETLAGLSEKEQRDLLRLLDRLGRKG